MRGLENLKVNLRVVLLLFVVMGLTAGCSSWIYLSRDSTRNLISEDKRESFKKLGEIPYLGADRMESLVKYHLEFPKGKSLRRFYWTDKNLWGNRGFLMGDIPKGLPPPEKILEMPEYVEAVQKVSSRINEALDKELHDDEEVVIVKSPLFDENPPIEELIEEFKHRGQSQKMDERESQALVSREPVAHQEPRQNAEDPSNKVEYSEYRVGKDENLWKIAARQEVYGNPLRWHLIYEANRDKIIDPNRLIPGQLLRIPKEKSNISPVAVSDKT